MARLPLNRPASAKVTVSYDAHGGRRVKEFSDAYEARRFFVRKSLKKLNPAIDKVS